MTSDSAPAGGGGGVVVVFVSGCYDIIHAGHVQFFTDARALGDRLIVSFASAEVLWRYKRRRPSIPDEHKKILLESFRMVDQVIITHGHGSSADVDGLDFEEEFLRLCPNILVVTEDDQYGAAKRHLCEKVGARYVVLPKTRPRLGTITTAAAAAVAAGSCIDDPATAAAVAVPAAAVSTRSIVQWVQAPTEVPLRVDFAGGWLDVPRFARPGAYIVNCAISPLVSLREWPYEQRAGLGGSGAWALLQGRDAVAAEIHDLAVGWQDPAVIAETGLCVWRSGPRPVLDVKRSGDFLDGCLALRWTGISHDTPGVANVPRDWDRIAESARVAREGVLHEDLVRLAAGVELYYATQLDEGMTPLRPEPVAVGALAGKYCGGGHGGYALYLFATPADRDTALAADAEFRPVEPFCRVY